MKKKEIINKYMKYSQDVVNNQCPACTYIYNACQRNLKRFDRDDMYFDTQAVDRVVNFIQNLKHFSGEFAGKPFVLEPWQLNMVSNVFGWKWKATGLRVCRNFYLEIGRKNGKSALMAAIMLYLMIADNEPNAQVMIAANSAKQAGILFSMCSNMLRGLDKKNKYFKRYRDSIIFDKTLSKIQVVAADAGNLDGFSCNAFCCDELHEAPDGKVYSVLETSEGARRQPLACVCTTAGFNLSSFCYEMRKANIEVISGLKNDDSLQAFIYTLDDNMEWDNPDNWIYANPNLGVSVKKEFIQQQIDKAKNNPNLELSVRTKLCNQWLASHATWIPMHYIFDATKTVDISEFKDYTCTLGVDLAAVCDLTCLTCIISLDGIYYVKNFYFLPSSALEENSNAEKYKQWYHQGYLILTQGNVTDYDVVRDEIKKINKYLLIDKVCYDQWNATSFAIDMESEGFNMHPFSQSMQSMNRPTKELQRLIMSGKVVIDDNPITRWCFDNSVAYNDANGNVKIVKESNQQKIDGVISMINALGGMITEQTWDNELMGITI